MSRSERRGEHRVRGRVVAGLGALGVLGSLLAAPAWAAGGNFPITEGQRSQATEVAQVLGAELVPMGSAGAKAMAVIRGDADIYLHSGGQFEWDSCAPVAVALAHGLHASRIDGSPLVYNRKDTYLPDLLICRKEHAARILAEVSALV